MTDSEAAEAVRRAVAALNEAIRQAHDRDIVAEFSTMQIDHINKRATLNVVAVDCKKVL